MKRRIMYISSLLTIGFMVTACHSATGETTIYVATDGDDHYEGTIDRPLRSLEAAAEKATAGSTIVVREGTYFEPLVVQHSGTKQQPVRFEAYQEEDVYLSGEQFEDTLEDQALIEINGHHDITIDGFTIGDLTTDHIDKTVIGILITGASQNVSLVHNTIENVATTAIEGNAHGIAVYGNHPITDLLIESNTLTNLSLGLSEALVVNGDVSRFTIQNNHVYETDNIGIDAIGYEGVALNKANDYARDGVIQGNRVHHNSSYNNPSYNQDYSAGGIYIDGGSSIIIRDNTVYQNDIGIEATSEHKGKFASEIEIIANEVYDNHYTGIAIGGYDSERGGTSHTRIAENVLANNDTIGLEGGQLLIQYYSYSNRFEQNQLTASPTGLFISSEYEENHNTLFSKNVYVNNNQQEPRWLWNSEEVDSLPAFQRLTRSDNGSVYLHEPI
ncbi:parallel beta-helix repeat protein [Alkalihalobacillus xiaoxiensis]|uniref:Parallel beta-helix repeat protein n=1 Tax=Shouchella xiaoxiensis TaxID=766895 RepID=A0ABS2T068_9BACI|nr:right-handed parallel beta-helix repeat-containing protein [Shouchella xiaoxiensis]MBM7840656.1 parallel beta-helix repeat protein [Shouchella xiaoxiensis]